MAYPNNLAEYRMMLSAEDKNQANSKLGLFTTFSKLYEQDRKLLDDMLAINPNLAVQLSNYIQGVVDEQTAYIISNLATGNSQRVDSTDSLWTIGRDPRQSDIAIPDRRLSRCHAALQYDPRQGFLISDLGSTNGTYINGEQLKQLHLLDDGDRVRIGNSLFHFFHCSNQANQAATIDNPADDSDGERTLH